MRSSHAYTLLNGRANSPLRVGLQLGFGALLGLLLGMCLNFESETGELEESLHLSRRQRIGILAPNATASSTPPPIWLRCVVLVDERVQRLHKFLPAVRDTYARGCNETLLFTSSKALQTKFAASMAIYLVDDDGWEPMGWKYFHRILQFLHGRQPPEDSRPQQRWTAMLGVQNYLVTANLRRLVGWQMADAPLLGRLGSVSSLLSYAFPLAQRDAFNLEAGVVLSERTVAQIVGSDKCSPDAWFSPRYAGKALLRCARAIGADAWDPLDEDGHHLFVPANLKAHFSQPLDRASGKREQQARFRLGFTSGALNDWGGGSQVGAELLARCCSHAAIAFGQLNYQEIRLLDFAVHNLRVFGL